MDCTIYVDISTSSHTNTIYINLRLICHFNAELHSISDFHDGFQTGEWVKCSWLFAVCCSPIALIIHTHSRIHSSIGLGKWNRNSDCLRLHKQISLTEWERVAASEVKSITCWLLLTVETHRTTTLFALAASAITFNQNLFKLNCKFNFELLAFIFCSTKMLCGLC